MTQKQSIWKKTAATTLALSMIVGGATGVMASANSQDKSGDWKQISSKDHDKRDNKGNKVQK